MVTCMLFYPAQNYYLNQMLIREVQPKGESISLRSSDLTQYSFLLLVKIFFVNSNKRP